MNTAKTERFIFIRKSVKYLFCLIFFCLIASHTHAQKFQITFDNIPLSDALVKASAQLSIKVAFDSEKLHKIIVHKTITGNTPVEFIQNLLLDTGFSFDFKHDRFLIIDVLPTAENSAYIVPTHITGQILDIESGEQLPYATVKFPELNMSTSATEEGSFSLTGKIHFPVHLLISYIGYHSLDTSIAVSQFQIRLTRKVQSINQIEIKENKSEMVDFRNNVDFATTINPAKLNDLPVLAEPNIFKALQLMSGITYAENSSELNIRGGSSDQNLILYDGQTLYNISHFYGLFSSVNPNIVKDIQVFKGGFDSRYGERVSAIIDITGKTGNRNRTTVYGDINLISANIAGEIPVGQKLTLVLAGRRSFTDIYATNFATSLSDNISSSFSKTDNNTVTYSTPSFYFYDYNAKLSYAINNLNHICLSYFSSKDYFSNAYAAKTNKLDAFIKDNNTFKNYGISFSWSKQWNSPLFTNIQLGGSGYSDNYSGETVINPTTPHDTTFLPHAQNNFNTNNSNKLSDVSFTVKNTYTMADHQVNFGLSLRRNTIFYHKDADMVYVYDNTHQKAWTSSFYILDKISLTKRLTLKPGFRLSGYDETSHVYFEPRFSALYSFSDHVSVRMATGRFFQFISQIPTLQETSYNKSFWALADDSVHPVIESRHYILGTTFEQGAFLIDAETYYKSYSGLQEYIFVSPYFKNADFKRFFPQKNMTTSFQESNPQNETSAVAMAQPLPNNGNNPSYFLQGTGTSVGLDISIRYRYKNFTTWFSYSLSRCYHRFPTINNDQSFPAQTDQRHQVSCANVLSIGNWNLGTVTLYGSGRPYIDFANNTQDLPTIRVYKRLPDYFRTDISANYSLNIGKVRFKTGVTLINILNTQNYYDANTRKLDFENTSFTDTNLIRAQKLSLNVFTHFVF